MKDFFESIKKYNFWGNSSLDLGFSRKIYIDEILNYAGTKNRLVKVIVGQRRVGKSYVMRQIIQKLIDGGVPSKNTLYINKEFTDFDFLLTYRDLEKLFKYYISVVKPKGCVYIFVDEIQNIDGWEHFVNSKSQDFTGKYEVFVSGSNSKMLSGELATLLSGRYVEFEILPFSFSEYCGITGKRPSRQSYIDYMNEGALPELFVLPSEDTKRNYIASIKDTVLLRDIIQRHNIKDAKLLEDVFVYLVNNASNFVSIPNIVNYFKSKKRKTAFETIVNYAGYMEDAFLIHKVERYDIKGKDVVAGNCKYYLNDLSFKNYLYPGFGYGAGYKLENLVYLELRRAGFKIYVGAMRNKEIDFVAQKGDRKIYVQSSYMLMDEETVKREYAPLKSIQDNYEKFVVSLDDSSLPSDDGIRNIQAWELGKILKF